MLDLNHILLFIAFLSPVVVLVRTWPRAALNRGWRLASVAVLVVTALAFWFVPTYAGFVGGSVWLLLLFLPAFGLRKAAEFSSEQRYGSARRVLGALRFLHPVRGLGEEHLLAQAMELAQNGEGNGAAVILDRLTGENTPGGRKAFAQSLRLRHDWPVLVAWCREEIPRFGLGETPALLLLYLRALGELGEREELVMQLASRAPALLASPAQHPTFLSGRMLVLAFCGRTDALRRLFATTFRGLRSELKEFWIATSEAAAGHADGFVRLKALGGKTADALLRADIDDRLRRNAAVAPRPLSEAGEAAARRFERDPNTIRGSIFAPRSTRVTPAVATLILLNVGMFATEILLGGSTNSQTLYRLGALTPITVLYSGQYWRLVSALFLHFGPLHLLFNLYALYILGPPLEVAIGRVRFAICYIGAGIGSSAGVVLLWRLGLTRSDFLVGASGSVMGIVGAWAGILLSHRHAPLARQRLINIGVIVAMQTAFDLSTPQVSMGAHLCGLITGVVIGLVIAPREMTAL